MEFVDTHCHLDFDAYKKDISNVIRKAIDSGVTRIIVPGLNLSSSLEAIRLAEKFSEVFSAVGVHPSDVDTWQPQKYTEFESLLHHEKVVAVGEIGLDYYHRQDNIPLQKMVLKVFLDLAEKYEKPVILHSRDCLQDLISIIENHNSVSGAGKLRGVFHAFEGNPEEALDLTVRGYYLGAGGPVTYKNAAIKQEVFSKIDLSQLLLETDGPFLSPQAHRGKRNEPSFIPIIAEKIAELRHCDIKEVAEITTRNAKNLFCWD